MRRGALKVKKRHDQQVIMSKKRILNFQLHLLHGAFEAPLVFPPFYL